MNSWKGLKSAEKTPMKAIPCVGGGESPPFPVKKREREGDWGRFSTKKRPKIQKSHRESKGEDLKGKEDGGEGTFSVL